MTTIHRTIPVEEPGASVITSIVLSKDANRIITASDNNTIKVYDLLSGELRHNLEGHEGGVWAIVETGDWLVSGSTDRTVRIWDLVGGRCLHVFGGHTSTVRVMAVVQPEWVAMEDGTREQWPKEPLIVSGSRDHTMRVWTLPKPGDASYSSLDDAGPYHLQHLQGHEHAVRAVAARGRTVVSGSYDRTVRVWDPITGQCRLVLVGHTEKVYSVVLDPIYEKAYSGSMDGTVRIWDTKYGQRLHTLTGHTSLLGLLSISPMYLVSAAADSTLRVWNPETGALLHVLAEHTGAVTCFYHDDVKVLSGSDGSLKLWDIRDGSFTRDVLTNVVGVWQVACAGRWCVAASNQIVGGQSKTVLDVWDFSGEGADWVD
uniref:WD40 repeat-like protein n=1 Tax=Mycena chlorophos TaxID=658473 RepID=A0ABQ0M4Q7_MYCCL|nr:WD40 repeat-like protein [Mycena chlorophos]